MKLSDTFDAIYRDNGWNGVESRSGPGSGYAPTRNVALSITALAEMLRVESVLDVGCGDGLWMPPLPGYIGVDVSRYAIRRARVNHPDRVYIVDDGPFPTCDLAITRDAMQHLSFADGTALLDRILASDPRWLLASTYVGGRNVDIRSGAYFEPDLAASPYRLGPPLLLIQDGWDYATPNAIRHPGKYLGLWMP